MVTGKGCGHGANYLRGWCQVLIPSSEPECFPSLLSSSLCNHTAATLLTNMTTSMHLTCLDPSHPLHFRTVSRLLGLRLVPVNHCLQETRAFYFTIVSHQTVFSASDDPQRPSRWMSDIGYGHVTALNHLIKIQHWGVHIAPIHGWFWAETWALPRFLDFIALIKLRGKCLLYMGIWQHVEFYPVSCSVMPLLPQILPFFWQLNSNV